MDISANPALVNLFFKQVIEPKFTEAYNQALQTLILNKIGVSVPSISSSTVHGWVNQLGAMKEWTGPRNIGNVSDDALEVTNRLFSDGFEIPRSRFDDDTHGLFSNNAAALGNAAAFFKDQLLIEALLRGTSVKWVDNVAIFDGSSNRKFDGSTAINNYVTTALGTQALEDAYAAMTSYIGHAGRPLAVRPKYLLHGPKLRARVKQQLDSEFIPILAKDGASYVAAGGNPNQGLLEAVETPLLVDGIVDSKGNSYNAAYHWFVIGEVAGIKPLAYQARNEPEFQDQKARADSEYAFDTDKYQWGVRMRGEAFVALPFMVYGGFATA